MTMIKRRLFKFSSQPKRNFPQIPLFCGGRFWADVQYLFDTIFSGVRKILDFPGFWADVQYPFGAVSSGDKRMLDFPRLLADVRFGDGLALLNPARILEALRLMGTLPLPCLSRPADGKAPQVGGQAVIEGVMMRSPDRVAVAVRKPGGIIVLKEDAIRSWTKRSKILGLPFVRGGVILIESMVLGVKALNFSSEIAMSEGLGPSGPNPGDPLGSEAGDPLGSEAGDPLGREIKKAKPQHAKKPSAWLLGGTVALAFALGLALFFYLPLKLTEWMGVQNGIAFNLVDGGLRLVIFLVYIGLISLWKDIHRIFEYHGAEHKSIFAYENDRPLTVEGVKPFSTFHPRCGTSFLLVVMLVSICVFIPLGRPDGVLERLVRFMLIPVIGGVSYEIIKLAGTKAGRSVARLLVEPGLWLQRITTKEPDDAQLEVALAALKSALGRPAEKNIETVAGP